MRKHIPYEDWPRVRVSKPHKCYWCGKTIFPGGNEQDFCNGLTNYQRQYAHRECHTIAQSSGTANPMTFRRDHAQWILDRTVERLEDRPKPKLDRQHQYVAQKDYTCHWCGGDIHVGSQYRRCRRTGRKFHVRCDDKARLRPEIKTPEAFRTLIIENSYEHKFNKRHEKAEIDWLR